jgi:Mlc titration factor MtfA (ptsG expression regulator)
MIPKLAAWWRGRQAARLEIPDALWDEVERDFWFLDHLDAGERAELRRLAREFIAAKQWAGAQGLELTPRIQLAIALQACLPILKLGLDWYDGWVGIIVYPGDFIIPRQVTDDAGVLHEYDDTVMGEAWLGGPVLLSWYEDADCTAGINVVIHEFAHKLDMRNGDADGMPPLHDGMSRRRWAEVLGTAFEDFQRRVDSGEDTLIDPYAAELPGEFFAVTSEVFFEDPELLQEEYPAVYEQLRQFYRQDPAAYRAVPR